MREISAGRKVHNFLFNLRFFEIKMKHVFILEKAHPALTFKKRFCNKNSGVQKRIH